ncbi:hypothetical protein F5Y19DRAFT_163567 [Xylariaceae sp. FL1651]|nr:hypothetical protein F5Y19DRAFT_163567 [Xylariaceae sp. FL1651]
MGTEATGSSPSRRRQTALAAVESFNTWTMDAIMAVRTDDCIHQVLPGTSENPIIEYQTTALLLLSSFLFFLLTAFLASLGRPPMDNATYGAYFSTMIPHFKDFKVTVQDLVEDAHENKVVVWARSTASTEIGPYKNEYMLLFEFNEAGDKITKFLEFVDSANSVVFFPKLRDHIAQKASVEEKSSSS